MHRRRPVQMSLQRVWLKTAEPQEASRADRSGGCIEQRPIFHGRAKIPWRNAVGRTVSNVIVGAFLGGFEEMRIAAVFVAGSEAVQRPHQASRPARVSAIALV